MTRDRIDTAFSALADPSRRAIVARLTEGPATCGALVDMFDITQQAVSKHIRVLNQAGLLTQRKVGRERLCELCPAPLDGIADWVDTHRRMWEQRFDALDEFLEKRDYT